MYARSMELLFGYPAMLAGAVAGYAVARREWPVGGVLILGVLTFAALTVHQSTVPEPYPGESGPTTAPLWALIAVGNAGSWILGVGMGVACGWESRARRTPRTR